MAMRRIDDNDITSGCDQPFCALKPIIANRRCRRDAQTPLSVLAGTRVLGGLFDVFHGDEADAVISVIDHDQLFNAMLMQKLLGVVLADCALDGDEVVFRHQLGNGLIKIGSKAHVAVR